MKRRPFLPRYTGSESQAAAVMACDDDVLPDPERLAESGVPASREAYDPERHLLEVTCTRVRDAALVTSVEPMSEFLDDFAAKFRAARRPAAPRSPKSRD